MYRIKIFELTFSPSGGPLANFHHARLDGLARLAGARKMRDTFAMARGAAANQSGNTLTPVRGGSTNAFESWEEAPDSRVQNHGSLRTLTTAAEVTQMPPSVAALKKSHRHKAAPRLAAANPDAQSCAAVLKDQINSVANVGKVLLGAGEFERALELYSAALVINPLDKDTPDCAKTARTKIVTYGLERAKLEQAKDYLDTGDSAHAEPA
jgi:tetratricopeptide (TPR) repeat protein